MLRSQLRCAYGSKVFTGGRPVVPKRAFASSEAHRGTAAYEQTVKNLRIGSHTRVLYQGFTGRQATANAKESIEWGTKIVGGVKPGVEGEHLGLPIFPSVEKAVEETKPDASAIYVPGNGTASAIEEAIAAEIPLIVAVAEHVPIHDMLRIHQMLQTQSKSRLVGANCPGIIAPNGHCRIGFQPLPFYKGGHIGVVAKSGTLSYETVASLTRAGLGQSLCVSVGGDPIAGTDFVDALKVFEEDDDTHGIVLVGEIGGEKEVEAAQWIKEYNSRVANPKPIVALIAGLQAPRGRVMGHAGAWVPFTADEPCMESAAPKIQLLEKTGVTFVDHPEKIGEAMKLQIARHAPQDQASATKIIRPPSGQQVRGIHTNSRTPERPRLHDRRLSVGTWQRRTLMSVSQQDARDLLKQRGAVVRGSEGFSAGEAKGDSNLLYIRVGIDRTSCRPAIIISNSNNSNASVSALPKDTKMYAFPSTEKSLAVIDRVREFLLSANVSTADLNVVGKHLQLLLDLFLEKEAVTLSTMCELGTIEGGRSLVVNAAHFEFDDAAYRTNKRQEDIFKLRRTGSMQPLELEAEKSGIVHVALEGEGSIGTLVNGAGLAMNTVDALTGRGGHCANFLDTGGKATSETIKTAFKLINSDARVKVVFVNIFGGLTRCDMIAEGIMLAFKELQMEKPVVVRLRGTNEELGQKMIATSGLPLHAFDSFEDAAVKVISLAQQ